MGLSGSLWISCIISARQSILPQKLLERQRLRLLARCERQRSSRVITLRVYHGKITVVVRHDAMSVSTAKPAEVYAFMPRFPQPMRRQPSLKYGPTPYGGRLGRSQG